MQFVKLTFSYLKKAFPVLLVAAIVPAVVMGFFGKPFASITFLPEYYESTGGTFKAILSQLMSGKSLIRVYPIILMLIALIISCSYSLSIIEKHFKTGRLLLRSPFRSINNSMLSVLKVVPAALIVCILLMLLNTGLVSLIRFIFSGANSAPAIADCIITTLVSVLIYLIMVGVTVYMGVWAVIIHIFGFSLSDAFVEAIRTVSKKWLPFIAGIIVPVTIMLVPQILISALLPSASFTNMMVSMATYVVIMVYYCAYIMVSVYSLTSLERRDQKTIVPKDGKYVG